MNVLRTIGFWTIMVFGLVFPLPLVAFFVRDKKRFYQSVMRFIARLLLLFSLTRVEIKGRENVERCDLSKGLIIAANHFSLLDSFILMAKLPFLLRFTAFTAGFNLPFVSRFFRQAGFVGVGVTGIKDMGHLFGLYKIISRKEPVVMLSKASLKRKVVEFDPAIVEISNKYGTPILPIAIKGTDKVLPLGRYRFSAGRISVEIGKPAFFASTPQLERQIAKSLL